MFSKRLEFDLDPNELTALLAKKQSDGVNILDLTLSNPTRAGFEYPADRISRAFSRAAASEYLADPRGLPEARAAVSDYYRNRGQYVPPEDIIITASTSEAYSFIFRILADPGDRMLVPCPGYPLFDYLLRLDGLNSSFFRMKYSHGWWYDFSPGLIDETVKGVIIVNPGNPAGNYIHKDEWDKVLRVCGDAGISVICDEVFHEYAHPGVKPGADVINETGTLSFILNGFSKTAGLPQLKMSWIAVRGPEELKRTALRKLEFVSDAYLSPSTAVQAASGEIFKLAPLIREQVKSRASENLEFLRNAVQNSSVDVLLTEGGWSAIIRLPGVTQGVDWALYMLDRHDLLTHPGEFYDMPEGSYLVLSLLPEGNQFREGVTRILRAVSQRIAP